MSQENAWLDVDFCEIPQGNISNGEQDAFELFARDLFEALGFKIVKVPARGADDRKDIIISESRAGILGKTEIKHLVSCKHYAHTKNKNRAVGNNEEPDVIGRIRNNGCQGFIGFYSTIASESLQRELKTAQLTNKSEKFEVILYDKAKIVDLLHQNEKTIDIYKRYFPKSFRSHLARDMDSMIYNKKPTISCEMCKVDLLESMCGKIVKLVKIEPKIRYGEPDWDYTVAKVNNIIFSCDTCFEQLKATYISYQEWPYRIDANKISSYTNPTYYIDNLMKECVFIRTYPDRFSESAFSVWNRFNRAMFYYVSRQTKPNQDRANIRPDFNQYNL